ncbi:MAG: amino acid racemase [Alphaproteobacteria bacterium]
MPLHIGIVGCTAEGAALCYRTICEEGAFLLGGRAHPEVSLHNHSLAEFMTCLTAGDWQRVADLILTSAGKLAKAGADFFVCPANTVHQAFPLIAGRAPIPFLHIGEVTAEHAKQRSFRRVGILGTRSLVESEIYPSALAAYGLDYVRPEAAAREEVNCIIFEELTRGIFKPQSVETIQRAIVALKSSGCDSVVLGCTEIPLVIDDANSALPTLDSTRLLARAALRRACV